MCVCIVYWAIKSFASNINESNKKFNMKWISSKLIFNSRLSHIDEPTDGRVEYDNIFTANFHEKKKIKVSKDFHFCAIRWNSIHKTLFNDDRSINQASIIVKYTITFETEIHCGLKGCCVIYDVQLTFREKPCYCGYPKLWFWR